MRNVLVGMEITMNKNIQLTDCAPSNAAVEKPTRQRFLLLAILFIGISIAYLDRVNVAVIAANEQFLAEMGIAGDPVNVGLMMSLFLLAYGLANVLLSPIGDSLGPRKAMLIAYLIICASLLMGGVAGTFGVLLASRVLLGIGEGLYYPMQNTLVKNWFPPAERGRANTVWLLGQSLAPAVAMPVFTFLVSEYAWQSTFHFSFALSLIPLLLIAALTADRPARHKRVNESERNYIEQALALEAKAGGVCNASNSSPGLGGKRYLLDYRFWLLMLILATNSILSWGLLTWFPSYLKQARGFSWETMGLMSALPFVFGLVFKLIAGIVIDRNGRSAPVILLSALLCASALFLGMRIDHSYIATTTIALGIGVSSMQIPAVFTLLQGLVPTKAISSAGGTLNGIAVGFGALSPVLIGFATQMSGSFDAAFYLLIVIVLAGGALAAVLAAQKL